jgi:acyl-CoA synthetase (AMP-forming)/AMP-acid ligase II
MNTRGANPIAQEKIHDVPVDWFKRAYVDDAKYREMYARSVSDPNRFWAEQAKCIDWIRPFHKVENVSFAPGNVSIKWFEDGVLNVAWNCIDRHLDKRGALMTGKEPSEPLRKELVAWVRKDIGPIASPDLIQFAPGLPKTRSGKIMRRILRKIAEDEPLSLGDTSTLADPAVVDDLVHNGQNKKRASV